MPCPLGGPLEFVIDLDDEVIQMIDDEAARRGIDRKKVMEGFVTERAASRKLKDLIQPRANALSDEEAEELVATERRAVRAERRRRRPASE